MARYVVEIESTDVTIDVYCGQCRRKCRPWIPENNLVTYELTCRRHGRQAIVTQEE